MIVTKISDGMGNQMFMYACGYAVSKRINEPLILDASVLDNHPYRKFELYNFDIECKRIISFRNLKWKPLIKLAYTVKEIICNIKFQRFEGKDAWIYETSIQDIKKNTYLAGYWQSEKYFKEFRPDLLRIFKTNISSKGAENYIQEVSKVMSVSVHLRRGDYVKAGICIDEKYYRKAIKFITEKVEKPVFYVISDDLDYAKKIMPQFGKNEFRFVEYESDNSTLDDFSIMSKCKHSIIANSSFSWWAAWLNQNEDKIVIAPKVEQWDGDFYPDEWIKIKVEAEV